MFKFILLVFYIIHSILNNDVSTLISILLTFFRHVLVLSNLNINLFSNLCTLFYCLVFLFLTLFPKALYLSCFIYQCHFTSFGFLSILFYLPIFLSSVYFIQLSIYSIIFISSLFSSLFYSLFPSTIFFYLLVPCSHLYFTLSFPQLFSYFLT